MLEKETYIHAKEKRKIMATSRVDIRVLKEAVLLVKQVADFVMNQRNSLVQYGADLYNYGWVVSTSIGDNF